MGVDAEQEDNVLPCVQLLAVSFPHRPRQQCLGPWGGCSKILNLLVLTVNLNHMCFPRKTWGTQSPNSLSLLYLHMWALLYGDQLADRRTFVLVHLHATNMRATPHRGTFYRIHLPHQPWTFETMPPINHTLPSWRCMFPRTCIFQSQRGVAWTTTHLALIAHGFCWFALFTTASSVATREDTESNQSLPVPEEDKEEGGLGLKGPPRWPALVGPLLHWFCSKERSRGCSSSFEGSRE